MKKKVFTFLFSLVAIATTAQAQVVLNETNFPDANFRAALAEKFGISEGDEITEAKIAATTELNVSNKKITDLTGIEHFAALTGLSCGGNQLTSLDVSKNTALTWLSCGYSQLTSLDVSKNTALTSLGCIGNQLTSLDVSKNAALTSLTCYFNQLTSLDVSRCTALKDLECSYNQLTSLDVSKNTALTGLGCSGNRLTSLDVSQNTALTWLNCNDNQLTSLDVSSKNTALERLNCRANKIKSKEMDALVESLPMVESGNFYVINTKYKNEGNVCTKSQVGIAKGKGWTVYDYNGGNSQEYEGSEDATAKLLLNAENFPDANFRAALASILGISEGDEITAEKIAATTTLKVNSKSIADLTGIEHFTALKYLSCYYNQLTSLDVSGCTALTELYCHSNQLTALDVSGCTALTRLECYYNQLTSLDVSKNTALTGLNCDNNQLTALDVSKNTALEWLFCRNNQLASLDVSKNTALRVLYCFSNQINGEAMDVLVASLPTVNSGSFFVIDTRDENEGNVCTKAQVAVAKGKGWTVCDFNGGNYPYPEYEGSDPVAEGTSEPYAVLSTDNTILTFYYDGLKETRGGMGVGPFSDRPDRGWDSERESITTVVFDASFADCTTLTSTSLWFFGCNNLSTIEGLHNLKTDNVTDMGSMFFECSSLTTLDLSTFNTENVTYMGMMFQYCYNLRELNISNFNTSKVESFFQMFVDCYSLTSLDVSSFNTENAVNMRWMFGGCSKLTSLDVSNFNTQNVVTMGEMFNRCYNLTSLDLSSFDTRNVSTMWSMFRNCYSLTTIYVGDGWTTNSVSEERGANMFTGCIKLVGGAGTSYNADFTDYTYAHIDGGSENPGYFTDKNAEQTFNDGDLFTFESVEGVALTYRVISAANRTCQVGGGDYNVRACDVNTTGTVTVPEVAKGFRVTTVGGYAFYKCSGLTQINLPETIKSIVYCAFQGCSGLTSFVIPSSVTSLSGNHQWNGCTGLTSIHIPANVTSMGNHTFANCPNILEVTVDENNPVYESPAGSHAIINKSKKSIVQGFKNTVIPEGITYIESAAFVGNEYNDIVLPKSFNGFYWDAFEYNAVRSITVAEGNTHFDSRNNCNALMETATDKLVKGCANTVIPSETKIIGEWAFAYAYDSNDYPSLKTVVLPEGLTKIGNWAFGYCKDLEEVTIPSTVTEIMYNAFVGSDNMKKLVSYIQEPFALGEYAFDVWQNKIITLYVPRGTKSLYESTEGWKEFQNIVEMDMNPVEDGDNIDFGTDMNEGDDLNGNVIGDIYYNINTGDGGYDAAEGCIVVKKPTDDGTVNDLEGKDIFGEDFKSQFTGIVFKVPAGKGTIKVNAETTGNMLLKVKIGANDPVEMELNGKLKVTFPYNVSETTYVYIYAGAANEAKGFGTTNDAEDAALKIYGIEFIRDNTPTEINAVDSGELTVDSWYTIDGKKLAGEPKEKGVYINKGRKVVK